MTVPGPVEGPRRPKNAKPPKKTLVAISLTTRGGLGPGVRSRPPDPSRSAFGPELRGGSSRSDEDAPRRKKKTKKSNPRGPVFTHRLLPPPCRPPDTPPSSRPLWRAAGFPRAELGHRRRRRRRRFGGSGGVSADDDDDEDDVDDDVVVFISSATSTPRRHGWTGRGTENWPGWRARGPVLSGFRSSTRCRVIAAAILGQSDRLGVRAAGRRGRSLMSGVSQNAFCVFVSLSF